MCAPVSVIVTGLNRRRRRRRRRGGEEEEGVEREGLKEFILCLWIVKGLFLIPCSLCVLF